MRTMICESLDDDPCFKVDGLFNIRDVQAYHVILKLIDMAGCFGALGRDDQAMDYTLLVTVRVGGNNQSALLEVTNAARVVKEKLLVEQFRCPVDTLPADFLVVDEIEGANISLDVNS